MNYCLGCHSLQYIRYNRIAEDLGLTDEQVASNLMSLAKRPLHPVLTSMPARKRRPAVWPHAAGICR